MSILILSKHRTRLVLFRTHLGGARVQNKLTCSNADSVNMGNLKVMYLFPNDGGDELEKIIVRFPSENHPLAKAVWYPSTSTTAQCLQYGAHRHVHKCGCVR